jgi:hypothetical protein
MASVIFPEQNNSLDEGNASHFADSFAQHVTPSRRGQIWYEHFLARNTVRILFDLVSTCMSTRLGHEGRIVTRLVLSPVTCCAQEQNKQRAGLLVVDHIPVFTVPIQTT